MNKIKIRTSLFYLLFLISSFSIFAQIETASPSNIDQIHNWIQDGKTTKIIFPVGTYNFSRSLLITNDNITLEGSDRDNTILKLIINKGQFLNAKANNVILTNITLDGNNQQEKFGNSLFYFNKSKGHTFENIHFKNSLRDGISSPIGWACEGFHMNNCEFSSIGNVCINIFNRNTNKRGSLISAIDKFEILNTTFNEGYTRGVVVDCGNDRRNLKDGTGLGPRITTSTSLNLSEVKGCHFYKNYTFQIGCVQTKDFNISDNTFEGMIGTVFGECIHFEQFTQNTEIFNNVFKMENDLPRKFHYIATGGDEGHKRFGGNDSTNPDDWRFKLNGGNERRGDPSCTSRGHIDTNCKRVHHSYGSKNIYIAGNTFESSNSVKTYIAMAEGESNFIGWKRDGTQVNNTFLGGKKISLSGNHLGSCDIQIAANQGISLSQLNVANVTYGLQPCSNTKPNVLGTTNIPSATFKPANGTIILSNDEIKLDNDILTFSPNPASRILNLSKDITSINISNIYGKNIKTIYNNAQNAVDISNISSGVYIIILHSKKNIQKVKKLIISN